MSSGTAWTAQALHRRIDPELEIVAGRIRRALWQALCCYAVEGPILKESMPKPEVVVEKDRPGNIVRLREVAGVMLSHLLDIQTQMVLE
jgi:hypothetical protein